VSTTYEFDLAIDPVTGAVVSTVTAKGIDEKTKALSEGFLGSISFLNQGVDLVQNKVIAWALDGARQSDPQGFTALGGGKTRYETGSHVDVEGYNLVVGTALGFAQAGANSRRARFLNTAMAITTATTASPVPAACTARATPNTPASARWPVSTSPEVQADIPMSKPPRAAVE
jgi:hypothetical protein